MSDAHSVLDAALSCDEGSFIGGCTACSACPTHAFGPDGSLTKLGVAPDSAVGTGMEGLYFKYPAGGCSYFKDTLCSYCDAIGNCQEDYVTCTNATDSICHLCDSGFWDTDCKECTNCGKTHWQVSACQQSADTVCEKCADCAADEYIETVCTSKDPPTCNKCSTCATTEYQVTACEVDADTVCAPCTQCAERQFIKEPCGFDVDTVCQECAQCEFAYDGAGNIVEALEYITEKCTATTDTVCAECTHPQAYKWRKSNCSGDQDAVYQDCTVCEVGYWEEYPCQFIMDTVCPKCGDVPNCQEGEITCHNDIDSICLNCEEGYFNQDCCFERSFVDCPSYAEKTRTLVQMESKNCARTDTCVKSNADFINMCMALCDVLPDCISFEVEDGGADDTESGPNSLTSAIASCKFSSGKEPKNIDNGGLLEGEVAGTNPAFDCYTNICNKTITLEGRDMSKVIASDKVIMGPDSNQGNAGVGSV